MSEYVKKLSILLFLDFQFVFFNNIITLFFQFSRLVSRLTTNTLFMAILIHAPPFKQDTSR